MKVLSMLLTAALAVLGAGCGESDGMPRAGPAVLAGQPAKDNTAAEPSPAREDYQRRMEANLDAIEKQIQELKRKAAQAAEARKPEIDRAIAELERQKKVASQKLAELRTASEGAWHDAKLSLDAAWENLKRAYEKACTHFE